MAAFNITQSAQTKSQPRTGSLGRRHFLAKLFGWICTGIAWLGLVVLSVLLIFIAREGLTWIDWQFISSFPSRFPEKAGIKAAICGTLWLISMTATLSIPIGVATAVYLEEYARKGRISSIIEVNISNLAGVPSIVYGILGLVIFVRFLSMGRSVLAGSLTMTLLILPVIIISSREAIRTVPDTIRQAAYALGATRWQTVKAHVLPSALPGILTGIILSLSRAIGETAPLVMMGALTYVAFVPKTPMDSFTALPIQIYNWASRPQKEFHQIAAAAIIILLAVLLLMNGLAVYIRHRAEKKHK